MTQAIGMIAFAAYQIGAVATFVKLTFLDGFAYTWWNWIVVIPINIFQSQIWPAYWLVVRPLMG